MIKRLILTVIVIAGIALSSFSQGYTITITPSSPDPNYWEGSTINYNVSFTGNVPSSIIFGVQAVNGTVVTFSINPYTQSYITIHWNCKVTTGSIIIVDQSTKTLPILYTYNTIIWSYSNYANFCNQTSPLNQTLIYGQTPTELIVNSCTPYCFSNYSFQYQWQEGDVIPGANPLEPAIYNNIPGAISATYDPPTYNITIIKAYRRISTIVENNATYQFNSKTALIYFNEPFTPGSISGSGFVYNNGIPDITQTPATGGWACNSLIQYTWEKSENNGAWQVIGIGQYYPNIPVTVDSRFRRSAVCGNNQGYSNIISYTVQPALSPGGLFVVPPSTLPYGSIPNIIAQPATGGLCLSSNYIYTWERSVDNGPWQVIATGPNQNYPSTVGIVGNSRFRRKVTCGVESLYTDEVSFTMTPYTSPNAENLNYLRINKILIPGVNNWPQADNLLTGDKIQATTYYDGLGRPIQNVDKEISELQPNVWGDATSLFEYDALGRESKSYLSYPSGSTIGKFKTNAKTEQMTYIQNTYGESVNAPTYSLTTFDNSPLSRIANIKESGDGWGGNLSYSGNSFQYEFNTALEQIKIWKIGFTETDMPVLDGEYGDGKLYKTVSIDEKQKKVYEYKDLSGHTILKKVQLSNTVSDNSYDGWLCTYYVYDDLDRLRATITPKAVTYLSQHSWAFASSDVYKELCFYSYFDERGRTVIKHSAGAGEIHIVYDKRDRMVLSQDENQRNRSGKQWSFFLYDSENRLIVSGLYDNIHTRQDLQENYIPFQNNGDVQISINVGTSENIIANNPVAGSSTYCLGCTANTTLINTVTYHDNYDYPSVKSFSLGFAFPSTTNPYVESSQKTARVSGMVTGSKVRVLDAHYDDNNYNHKFLTTTPYFDERGRALQGLSENINGGVDNVTMQYDYSGKTLSIYERQFYSTFASSKIITVTQFEYNKIGQTISISKQYHSLPFKKIAGYTYDAMGRVSEKKLSPDFNSGAGMESMKYEYNLHGTLIGINKDYALSNSSLSQWDHYFGMYLGYDNKDGRFTSAQYNGNLTGILWKTQGDNNPRKYDYEYDNANRLTAANFLQKEKPTDLNWATTNADFSMTNVQYDENGNLLSMNHKGIIPGSNSPVFVDKLIYSYKPTADGNWSNKLSAVLDNSPDLTATNNGLLGDFKNEFYNTAGSYTYDANGNMVVDNNKKIRIGSGNGVEYNYLDKPQKITIEGRSITEFIYDANGDKLGKKVTNTVANTVTTTWYNGAYVYGDAGTSTTLKLQYINHEEGRLRVYTPVTQPRVVLGNNFDLPDGLKAVFEYFVKDNLLNTRAIISEETHFEHHNCTMEVADANVLSYERAVFQDPNGQQVDNTRIDKTSPPINTNWTISGTGAPGGLGAKVCKTSPQQQVGPNMLLKVMAGDKLTLKVDYYFNATANNTSNNVAQTVADIIRDLLLGATSPGSSGVKGSAYPIHDNLHDMNGSLYQFLQNQNNNNTTYPRAYLNYLFFDENFKFIPYDQTTGLGSFCNPVTTAGDGQYLQVSNVKVPKNGYAFVYLSNSSNIDVYFDNLDIVHNRGRLVEENAYYPYGLKAKGICGKAYGKLDNKYGYQGDFAEEDEETGWDEFDLRMYNPQIGRWNGVDPYGQYASPYIGMGNNPANLMDPDGGGTFSLFESMGLGAVVGGIVGAAITKNGGNAFKNFMIGAGTGAVVGAGVYDVSNVNWAAVGGALSDGARWVSNLVQNPSVELYILNNTAQAFHMGHLATAINDKSGIEYVSVTGDDAKDGTADYTHYLPNEYDPVVDNDEPNKEYHLNNLKEGMDWLTKHYDRMFSIKVTKSQAKKVINGIIKFAKSGPYHTLTRNCADAVLQGLEDAKIFKNLLPGVSIPNMVYRKLEFYLPIHRTEASF